jgi:ABC-type antimicrobial peptide transport system permease subunit
MRSTMRMVLFQRMKEFGTLRAIGFSRVQCLYLVITEVVILGLVSLAVAVVGVVVFVLGFSSSGIRVPEGPLQYMFGGDHFYMRMALQDFILCVGLIAGLAFFSAFKPAGLLMYNRMTDILAGSQKRIFLTAAIIRGFTRKGSV